MDYFDKENVGFNVDGILQSHKDSKNCKQGVGLQNKEDEESWGHGTINKRSIQNL